MKSLSRVRLLVTPWTGAYQAPPSMGFSRQEYWSGVPSPSPFMESNICIISYKQWMVTPQTWHISTVYNSTVDTHQTQLAKCPNCISCSKAKFIQVHSSRLTWYWSLSIHPASSFHSTKEKLSWQPVVSRGEKDGSPKQMFHAAARNLPQIPISGPASQEEPALHSHPGVLSWP